MTILCYHAVDPDWKGSPLAVSPPVFEQHCEWLARHRKVVSLDTAIEMMMRRGGLPRGVVALTFDDGFESLFEHALPVLSKYGFPATVFLVAATLAERRQPVTWVDTPPSWSLRTLSIDQIMEMRGAGFTFESHSNTHADLTGLDPARCFEDLVTSRKDLESILDHPVRYLAYPRGFHNESVRKAAARAGYQAAFTLPSQREPQDRYSVPRVGVFAGNSGFSFIMKTWPLFLRVRTSRAYPVLRIAARGSRPPVQRAARSDREAD